MQYDLKLTYCPCGKPCNATTQILRSNFGQLSLLLFIICELFARWLKHDCMQEDDFILHSSMFLKILNLGAKCYECLEIYHVA